MLSGAFRPLIHLLLQTEMIGTLIENSLKLYRSRYTIFSRSFSTCGPVETCYHLSRSSFATHTQLRATSKKKPQCFTSQLTCPLQPWNRPQSRWGNDASLMWTILTRIDICRSSRDPGTNASTISNHLHLPWKPRTTWNYGPFIRSFHHMSFWLKLR